MSRGAVETSDQTHDETGTSEGDTQGDVFPPPAERRGAFVETHARLVYAALHRVLSRAGLGDVPGGEDVVEDLFAATFVAMFEDDARRLRQWDGRCSRETWLTLIASSVARDWVRAERRRERRLDREADPGRVIHVVDTVDDRTDETRHLREALARLSEQDRAVLTALMIDERPAAQVASEMGIALGALYTRKSRALDKLRAAFEEVRKVSGRAASMGDGADARGRGACSPPGARQDAQSKALGMVRGGP